LRGEDLYVLVMAERAGVMVERAALSGGSSWYEPFLTLDVLCVAAVGMIGIAIFFTPVGSFLRSDVARGCLFLAWVAALWFVGDWSRRRHFRR
jgi:hypothetical protein